VNKKELIVLRPNHMKLRVANLARVWPLTLIDSHQLWSSNESWENSHVNSRSSTLMQLLFSFDQAMKVEKTLMSNSHATLVLVWSSNESWENSHVKLSCNSCSLLIKQWKLRKLSCQTLMQLLFSFDQAMKVEKTLTQTLACQLSCNSCSRLIKQWKLRKLSCKLSLVNFHATLVLVWSSNESWENSHVNSRLLTLVQLLFSFDQAIKVEKTLM
jgi:hypothetical protein